MLVTPLNMEYSSRPRRQSQPTHFYGFSGGASNIASNNTSKDAAANNDAPIPDGPTNAAAETVSANQKKPAAHENGGNSGIGNEAGDEVTGAPKSDATEGESPPAHDSSAAPKDKKLRTKYTPDDKIDFMEQMTKLDEDPVTKKMNLAQKCALLKPAVSSSTFARWGNICIICSEKFAIKNGNLAACPRIKCKQPLCLICFTKQFTCEIGKIDGPSRLEDVVNFTTFKCPLCTHVCLVTPGAPCDKHNKFFKTVKFRDCLFAVMKEHYLSISERLGTHLITLSSTQYAASKIDVNHHHYHCLHMSVGSLISKFNIIAKTLVGARFDNSELCKDQRMLDNLKNWCASHYPGVKIPGHKQQNLAPQIRILWEAQRALTKNALLSCCDFFDKFRSIDGADEHPGWPLLEELYHNTYPPQSVRRPHEQRQSMQNDSVIDVDT